MTGVPFIFDMRARWPDGLITTGRMLRGSVLKRAIAAAERACLRRAGAVVSPTHAAVDHLNGVYSDDVAGQRVAVIPTCADLDRFVPAVQRPPRQMIDCLGALLNGWFVLDWLAAFLSTAEPNTVLKLTTRDDPAWVRASLDSDDRLGERLLIAPEDVQRVLQGQTASMMFFTDGFSKLGSSSTGMAEILGCGLPVEANDGVGDVDRIIRAYRVGVLVQGRARQSMTTAGVELLYLL